MRRGVGRCSGCGGQIRRSHFDAALIEREGEEERLFFGIPGSTCLECRSIEIDPEALLLLDIDPHNESLGLIESDGVLGGKPRRVG